MSSKRSRRCCSYLVNICNNFNGCIKCYALSDGMKIGFYMSSEHNPVADEMTLDVIRYHVCTARRAAR